MAAQIYGPLDDWEQVRSDKRYYYEEHTCPTNFVRTAQVRTLLDLNDTDPHGVFSYYDTVLFDHGRESQSHPVERSGELDAVVQPVLRRLQDEQRANLILP